ncbi:hypothetical protein F6W69_10600 [Microbacterium oxydans]|uniref:hypothetical protein n=1 Tax=Microbacterium oxydans TaxID=82380 RepID=UPI0011440289|nr:hypothetical protein [Microbacterium oxydans]KAB1891038.1 hypothetical protein F6W69_10600 [Microbacterium oxydans]GED39099.1 hypothetical protein MOX01_22410 [Microbacterium oxydans]
MPDQDPDITFTVTADNLEEAAQFAIDQLKALTAQHGHRGFMLPELNAEFILADPWRHCFEFKAEFLPQG